MAGNAGDRETQAKEISCTKWMTFEEVDKVVASASRRYVMRAANLETLKLMTCGGCVHKPSGYPSYWTTMTTDTISKLYPESIPTSNMVKLNFDL
jgi:hypothetical protein